MLIFNKLRHGGAIPNINIVLYGMGFLHPKQNF